jgi:nucleoside-diphosphate-sugar epimerase
MRYLVTGAAGFIGSHLCEALAADGHPVVGLDAFIPYYPRPLKERNLQFLTQQPNFTFLECDLRTDELVPALNGIDVIFHVAAMPGLVASWQNFDLYATCNIQATQRLLEAARTNGHIQQFIHASTSSIYGDYVIGPETASNQPVSPYGITKLAAEHLVKTYERQFGLPTTILRYFSVYGPRQRPDMGYQIFIERILNGQPITIFGDGSQSRSNTYVSDIVNGTRLASERFTPGAVYNIGGVDEVSAIDVIRLLEDITGQDAIIHYGPSRPGEQSRTVADITHARKELGYEPSVSIREGLAAQVEWNREQIAQKVASGGD